MNGGGASPAEAKIAVLTPTEYSGYVGLVSGGRFRVLVEKFVENPLYMNFVRLSPLSGNPTFSRFQGGGMTDTVYQYMMNAIQMYGYIEIGSGNISPTSINVQGKAYTISDIANINGKNIFDECGFVEGQARIITDYGNIACVVKNGTLYPIITEYDQQIEDNKCLTSLYLNGDNEVSGLQDMVDHPGRYLPYDNTTVGEPWSPVENYLHQNVKMPIVPKIGFEPLDEVGIGNVLPGLNYEVTL